MHLRVKHVQRALLVPLQLRRHALLVRQGLLMSRALQAATFVKVATLVQLSLSAQLPLVYYAGLVTILLSQVLF